MKFGISVANLSQYNKNNNILFGLTITSYCCRLSIVMEVTATITPKFQIHLPVAIRTKAGFIHHGPVVIRADGGRIIIEKKRGKSILDLAGKYKARGKHLKVDLANIRDYIDYGNLP